MELEEKLVHMSPFGAVAHGAHSVPRWSDLPESDTLIEMWGGGAENGDDLLTEVGVVS